MQTQKDHVHAYQFLMQRMTTALVIGDPSSAEHPLGRGRSGLITGAVVALLIAIGFGVYGLIVPGGNTAWQRKGAILVEKESGSRYVYLDGKLLPTPNQASAMLLQGPGSTVSVISRKSLAGLPRGPQAGITGAPDTVPRPNELMTGGWLLCPVRAADGAPVMSVNMDEGASKLDLTADFYAPVQSRDGKMFLIWEGKKYQVPSSRSLVALGLTAARTPFAPDVWLNLVPDGPALTPAQIAGAGEPAREVAGRSRRIGDLFYHYPGNGTQQRYVMTGKGLSPLSATEYTLLKAEPGAAVTEIDAQSVLAAPFSSDQSLLRRLPDLVTSQPVPPEQGRVCLEQRGSGAEVETTVVAAPGADGWPPVTEEGAMLPPNRGVLVAEIPVLEGQKDPKKYLINDRGRRFLIPDDDSMRALGLGDVRPIPMRTEVLSTIPAGPALSRAAVVVEQGG
ncbi:type VII secretion protein EccB [Lentzea sp. BCCO 10_0061]|uniref:Type VII secretion protein EccB n=1 Tax=Lentzea sokolovensis TaxID=3095429 RepID=A0ABU4VCD5_9PSEU|nr:type VII secretion protein EccB [Lentzea sp. BCCO 10_0061]MDX8149472.1 type VII secretion protein EccB [Lentzea sp. BCCO 10_0061]